MKVDLLISNIGQLVTCASSVPKRGQAMRDVGLIENAAIAVNDGEIVGVGRSPELRRSFEADGHIDAAGRVVCPGFVDPHTHIVFAGDRLDEFELKIEGADYLEILANGGGIISTVRKTREASQDDLVEQALGRLDKMLACGTTTAEVKTGYGLDLQTERKMLDSIAALDRRHPVDLVPTFLPAHAVPPEFKDKFGDYIKYICKKMLPDARNWFEESHFCSMAVPIFCDVFTERNACEITQMQTVLSAAKSLGFAIKAHVDQFTNLGGSRLAIEMNAASIDHLDVISDEEIALLARSGTIGVVIPTENFSAGKTHFAAARKMIDSDCAIALSTDYNPGSAPCPSQPMAMAISSRYQKLLPAEALNAATINAAFAIGMADKVGSIEVGKQADMLLVDAKDHREIVYEFGGNLVASVIKKGKVVG